MRRSPLWSTHAVVTEAIFRLCAIADENIMLMISHTSNRLTADTSYDTPRLDAGIHGVLARPSAEAGVLDVTGLLFKVCETL